MTMKCVATNRSINRKNIARDGAKAATYKIALFLDYALADKCGYSPKYIERIHATINKVIEDVNCGKTTAAQLQRHLEKKYSVTIDLGKDRVKPPNLDKDLVSGIYAFMDKFNVILLYVLIEKYHMKGETVNNIMRFVTDLVTCCNMGYATEDDIKQVLRDEYNMQVNQIKNLNCCC